MNKVIKEQFRCDSWSHVWQSDNEYFILKSVSKLSLKNTTYR